MTDPYDLGYWTADEWLKGTAEQRRNTPVVPTGLAREDRKQWKLGFARRISEATDERIGAA